MGDNTINSLSKIIMVYDAVESDLDNRPHKS